MLRITCRFGSWDERNMSRQRLSLWLLATGVLGVALSLMASSNRSAAPVANAPAAQSAVAKTHTASLPAQSGVAVNYPRHRYIVQSVSADPAPAARLRAGRCGT